MPRISGTADRESGGAGGCSKDTMVVSAGDRSDTDIGSKAIHSVAFGSGHASCILAQSDNDDGVLTGHADDAVACFTPGTLAATPTGARPVQDLAHGDIVQTRDNGLQRIVWAGQRSLAQETLAVAPDLCPIRIKAGALGPELPARDMLVSPNHRMLVQSDTAETHFNTREVLVPAKYLTRRDGIDTEKGTGVTYVHFMFEHHQVVLADGAWSESFQPGDYTLRGVGDAQRQEIFTLFPKLATANGLAEYRAARRSLNRQEAALLV